MDADFEGCAATGPLAVNAVFSLAYEELRRLAGFVRRNEPSSTINTTALVHEAWLKLKDSPRLAAGSLPHFKAIAARAMRQILVDEARRRGARKRDESLTLPGVAKDSPLEEFLAIHHALEELERLNRRQARIVECRFFAGLTVEEIAGELQMSVTSAERDWRAARAWLAARIASKED